MKGKASDICPNCKYCEGMVEDSFYICGVTHSDGGLYHLMGVEDELYCTAYEEEIDMSNLKVEGKVGEFCPKCKNCKGIVREYDGNDFVVITGVECEDPYDGMIKTLAADSDICCSMFDPKPPCEKCERFDGTYCHSPDGIFVTSYISLFGESGNCPSYEEKKEKDPCDKISLLQHELEMEKLRMKIHELEKEKAAHLKGIERLKNKNDKYLKKIIDQQATHYKQCARILELECAVNKLQSGEYDDILAKDIEIKSLQAKYEDVMRGWNHTMESHDMLSQTVSEQKAKIEELTKMVERRDRWVKELQSDVYTLQNEILTIRNIAQKAYDDTNRD